MENGLHVTIDGKECNKKKLKDFCFIYKTLEKIPELLDMQIITRPYVISWLDKGSRIPGISGFVIIAESHVSIHTYPETNKLFMDLFSCKAFDSELLINFVKKTFDIKIIKKNILKRD